MDNEKVVRVIDELTTQFNDLKEVLRAKNNRILALNRKLESQGLEIEELETKLYASVVKNEELSTLISELEREILDKDELLKKQIIDKDELLKKQGFNNAEDQEYMKLINKVLDKVLNDVHLEYVWRAVKQVLRDINVTSDFTDNDYKKIMERACRILTEDKRDILKQAWNNFLLFFNQKNETEIKNINCVLQNGEVNNGVYKELYRYFTASKSPTVYHWNKDVRNKALNLLDNESTYPSEKKRKTNKLRNTRNKTTTYLKKKRNQTRNFFKKKKQNITQKVENLRKRLFKKKNNNSRNMYNRKTVNNETKINPNEYYNSSIENNNPEHTTTLTV